MVQFLVISSEKKQGQFGDCYILTVIDKAGQTTKVWAPKLLQKEIEEESRKDNSRSIYFASLGQIKNQSGNLRNDYDICFY